MPTDMHTSFPNFVQDKVSSSKRDSTHNGTHCNTSCVGAVLADQQSLAGTEKGGKKAPDAAVPGAKERMQRMFTAASVRSRPAPKSAASTQSADALLDDILGDLGPGSAGCVISVLCPITLITS